MFKFSKRSLSKLEGVDPRLVSVAGRAIQITKVDFGVIEGLRTLAQQKIYFDRGASKTMKSKHLKGMAIDTMAYIGSRGSWELPLYAQIADAFAEAARQEGVRIRWGGAWNYPNIADYAGPMSDIQRSWDSGHFELN